MVCKSSLILGWLLHKNVKGKMRIYVTNNTYNMKFYWIYFLFNNETWPILLHTCIYKSKTYISNIKPKWGPSWSWSYGSWIYNDLCNISAYHHQCCEFKSRIKERCTQYNIYYVIKFVINLQQVGGFLRVLRFPPPIKLTATI
jgi:hypothetical protein